MSGSPIEAALRTAARPTAGHPEPARPRSARPEAVRRAATRRAATRQEAKRPKATRATGVRAAVAALLCVGALGACQPGQPWFSVSPDDAQASEGPPSSASPTGAVRALNQLAALQVKGRAPLTGYDRDLFGDAWADVDRNGCDTRNDILRRDLAGETLKPGTRGCVVLTGVLMDPYSGRRIDFERGELTSPLVQIDHVVALADAWRSGAQSWDFEKRQRFGNDPLNLLAVDGALNQQKGASNAASWLPPDRDAWCGYASQQIAVKEAYGLWVTQAEHDALRRAAGRCTQDTLLAQPGPIPLGE